MFKKTGSVYYLLALFASLILMTFSATTYPAFASVQTPYQTSSSNHFEIAQVNQPDRSDPIYIKGFDAGVEAARNGGPSSPTYDAPTIYINGYRDGYIQYTNGYNAGVEAGLNGGPSSPTYDAPSTYIEAYREGFASVSPGGSMGQLCLDEAFRQGYGQATVDADYTSRGGDIILGTSQGPYICTIIDGEVILYPY
ncbi:MAG: hypothetical protein F6K54_25860 [Okeania sp. SIO3B5]|uniref:hypothetical protein n=1 Tax=Okeania sp. SIO3B5 TaxID=2607811 RepID=UPI0013FE83F4|nr:hypothetical protein [Okeania sp. SIO3B5]NEO56203.1 hypothetical protein [Okeania sp. SIO3B5]